MDKAYEVQSDRGSLWHRWDPHIHTPKTALNDQYRYKDADPWEAFLTQIESVDPPIRALGITDYCTISRYEQIRTYKREGRLPGVGFIFPNVELRLSIETSKASPINLHILFDPSPHDHIDQINHFLLELDFSFRESTYRCQPSDLIRLGRAYGNELLDDDEALSVGVNQFKVNFADIKRAWKKNEWVKRHALIAVAGGEKDGTSGLRDENASFAALRNEIESFAQIIFSGNPKQTEFWLGNGKKSAEDLEREWNGCKPCLHGSDAHSPSRVGNPDGNRLCWLKGDLVFETLRQACIEPASRVYIGEEPPRGALQSNTINSVVITNAPWLSKSSVKLNPGFVAIIGARGSGKTALADLIAAGATALQPHHNERSFIYRAQEYLQDSEVSLLWESGERTGNSLSHVDMEEFLDSPHVQYLSQQFVDQLCSTERLDNSLVQEIQKVIFNAHRVDDRAGAANFEELLHNRLEWVRQKRERYCESFATVTSSLNDERARKESLKTLEKELQEKRSQIEKDKKDRALLVAKGNAERVKRHGEISDAVFSKRREIEGLKRKLQALELLKNDVNDFRARRAVELIEEWKSDRHEAGLTSKEWEDFKVEFVGPVDSFLDQRKSQVKNEILRITGSAVDYPFNEGENLEPLIPDGAILGEQRLLLLEQEQSRLAGILEIDAQKTKRYTTLSEKIDKAGVAVKRLMLQIERANEADARIKDLREQRRASYKEIFSSIVEEEQELTSLYAPLKYRIESEKGTLSKLSFSVKRIVDLESWAESGEDLLDLRKNGAFKGRGALLAKARIELLQSWESGDAAAAAEAMFNFVSANEKTFRDHMPDGSDFRTWASEVSDWLYGTSHIQVSYGLQYSGIDIERLSPGTRGIVLLLLYLAIDSEDDRPLIIDQPEENLDPQSVFNELVNCFKEAKKRRQIIIVTHNANLVVNTDADQVVVATCHPHQPGQLPVITYESGGLENLAIRQKVCDILEGGERAFKERAKRLRVVF